MQTHETTEQLYSPNTYPFEIREAIRRMPPLAITVANRWLLGWPKRVKGLIADGTYLKELEYGEEQERRMLVAAKEYSHLSSWEKAEVLGFDQECPIPNAMVK